MSDDIDLPKLTITDYFSHLSSLCSRLCKVYEVKDTNEELKSFKTKINEIRENKMEEDEDKLDDLERILIKLFKSIDPVFFDSSKCTTKELSKFQDEEVIRSKTFKILERKVIQMESEEQQLKKDKKRQKEDKKESKDKYKETTMKQDVKSNQDRKGDNQEDYEYKILSFLNENKSDQKNEKN